MFLTKLEVADFASGFSESRRQLTEGKPRYNDSRSNAIWKLTLAEKFFDRFTISSQEMDQGRDSYHRDSYAGDWKVSRFAIVPVDIDCDSPAGRRP